MTAADEIQRVTPHVIFWSAYAPEVKAELCAHAICGSGGWVLMDPIGLSPSAMDELNDTITPVAILITNGNHARAAQEFRSRFAIPILAHAAAAEALELSVDAHVSDGETIAGNLQVLGLPGAAPGEVALYLQDCSLHFGDALINFPGLGFTFLPDKYCGDAKQMRESLRRLLPLHFSMLTFAHGLPITGTAREQLIQLLS